MIFFTILASWGWVSVRAMLLVLEGKEIDGEYSGYGLLFSVVISLITILQLYSSIVFCEFLTGLICVFNVISLLIGCILFVFIRGKSILVMVFSVINIGLGYGLLDHERC